MNPVPRKTLLPLVAVAALGALLLGAGALGTLIVDTEFIRDRLVEEFAGGEVEIDLANGAFEPFRRSVVATDVVLTIPGTARLVADRVVVSGIPLLRHLFGIGADGPVSVGAIELRRPVLYVFQPADGSPTDSSSAESPPVLRVGRFDVEDGRILVVRPGATDGPSRVRLSLDRVEGDRIAFGADGRLAEIPETLDLRASDFERVRADGLTRLAYDSLRFSSDDAHTVVAGFRYEPVVPDEEFFDRIPDREDRVELSIPSIELRGVEMDVSPGPDFVVRSATADSIRVDVFSNKRIPSGGSSDPPWLPNTFARGFDEGRLKIDSIRANGRITYRELPLERVREPGRIDFEQIEVEILDVTNVPGAPPMTVDASLVLYGAPARVQLEIPLDAERFRMRNQGRVGSVDLTRLTPLVMPIEGIEIQDGRLEGMRYEITVDGPTAGGTVWAAYRDLDVQLVNRETGEGGLFDDIKSFVANNFVLEGENMPDPEDGEGSTPGTVAVTIADDDPFFTRLWVPIREGLMSIAR